MGTNGLKPALNEKCPDAPTKAKYLSSDAAWTAANKRSVETGLDIAPYACPGCGYFHLTKKVNGSDIVVKAGVGITTGALRKVMPTTTHEVPERVDVSEIGWSTEFRRKMLRTFLEPRKGERVYGAEVQEVLNLKSTSGVGPYMRHEGWEVSSHGRGAYWTKKGEVVKPIVTITPNTTKPALEASITRHPAGKAWRDVDLNEMPGGMTMRDLFDAYKAAGLNLRLQVSDV